MLEMVRQQMLCIISPDWPAGDFTITPQGRQIADELRRLFTDVGIVHFASIALLPALPLPPGDAAGAGGNRNPSLMLELAVEEGLCPEDLFRRLVEHPRGAMWMLYRPYWPANGVPADASERNLALRKKLLQWHSIADGAFVGARDRSVRGILLERDLVQHARGQARAVRGRQVVGDREGMALALSRWARSRASFEWASEPAPRSFWRGAGASLTAKIVLAGLLVGLALGLVWAGGAVARLAMRWDAGVFGGPHAMVQAVLSELSRASQWALVASWRAYLVLVVLGLLAWLLFIALPALLKPWRRWLNSLRRELDRPSRTWSSVVAYAGVLLVGTPLLLAVVWYAGVCVAKGEKPAFLLRAVEQCAADGLKCTLVSVTVASAALLFMTLASAISSRRPAQAGWFRRPHYDETLRGQQVHPSIERCESRLVRGTAHMISLTDMRCPYWWSAWWTRAVLRAVTLFGRIVFTEGRLGDARGIHFAHWHLIDGGRRYLFCANYDGTFGGYLDDFINGAATGTTLFWRWSVLKVRGPAINGHPAVEKKRKFPSTRLLALRGVKCEMKFKSYARDSMLPHLFRFDACNLSLAEIDRATALRDALFGERNDSNDDQIMRAVES